MSLENNMVVGQDDFDEVVECFHVGEWAIDRIDFANGENVVSIRCVDCGAIFEGNVSEVTNC